MLGSVDSVILVGPVQTMGWFLPGQKDRFASLRQGKPISPAYIICFSAVTGEWFFRHAAAGRIADHE
jgi:hypothetical protein